MRNCPKCDHGLKRMRFAGETAARLTCPDCGWRPERIGAGFAGQDPSIHASYVGRRVTLNGEPAKVVQTDDGFAAVAPLNPARGSVPFSWTAVYNVCDNHAGKFDGV